MVRTISVDHMRKIKRAVPKIEAKVKIRFSFGSTFVTIKGKETVEFIVEKIVQAIDFGFEMEDAFLLLDTNYSLEFIDIKEHTHRKNLHDVRSRVIGRNGKALNTIENLTESVLAVKDNRVGLISRAETIGSVEQAIESIIRGAKHGNAFAALERANRARRKEAFGGQDLGLRDKSEDEFLDEEI
ncbi:hypothetical protein HN747_01745 [archaeon]|jgi:KH domain-containing protein|nr:hypothetical protein [archaeon]